MSALSPRSTPEVNALAARISAACDDVKKVAGLKGCFVVGEAFAFPDAPERINFVILAGPRALCVLAFDGDAAWTKRIKQCMPESLDLRQGTFTLVVPQRDDEDRAPAAVAALLHYTSTLIDAHLATQPGDADLFPLIDDATLERMFD